MTLEQTSKGLAWQDVYEGGGVGSHLGPSGNKWSELALGGPNAGAGAAGEKQEIVGLANKFGLPCPGTGGEAWRDPHMGWQMAGPAC